MEKEGMKDLLEKIVIAILVCVGACMLYNNYNSKHEAVEDAKIISIREVDEKDGIVTLQIETIL